MQTINKIFKAVLWNGPMLYSIHFRFYIFPLQVKIEKNELFTALHTRHTVTAVVFKYSST